MYLHLYIRITEGKGDVPLPYCGRQWYMCVCMYVCTVCVYVCKHDRKQAKTPAKIMGSNHTSSHVGITSSQGLACLSDLDKHLQSPRR